MDLRAYLLPNTKQYGEHKGFYNDADVEKALSDINYSDFFEDPDDDFPYLYANAFLCGSCHIFALSLQKVKKYNPYIIQGNDKKVFMLFVRFIKKEHGIMLMQEVLLQVSMSSCQ